MSQRARRRAIVALSAAGFVLGAREARRGGVGPVEARCFERINALPHDGFAPMWAVMQLGSLAGPVAAGAVAAGRGRRRLGVTLTVAGSLTWLLARAVKPSIQRGRPASLLDGARVLGRAQTGLGYPSGHAAVAAALAAVASPQVTRAGLAASWATAAAVGAARIYVGAHLPLDVVGGMALGVAVGTAAAPYGSSRTPRSSSSSRASWRRG